MLGQGVAGTLRAMRSVWLVLVVVVYVSLDVANPLMPGAVTFGMGDKLQKNAPGNKTLAPGGYFLASAEMNHFAYTTQESTIVLYGQGPVEFKYVNASDDPRTRSTAD